MDQASDNSSLYIYVFRGNATTAGGHFRCHDNVKCLANPRPLDDYRICKQYVANAGFDGS